MNKQSIVVHWFRRDLRLKDNAALYYALRSGKPVLPVFIFDTDILDALDDKFDKRVIFIHQALGNLQAQLSHLGSSLCIKIGKPIQVWKDLLREYTIEAVYTNHDYEPAAIRRDETIDSLLKQDSVPFHTYKDQCIFEKNEVTKDDGKPYTVFTPYKNKCLAKLNDFYLKAYPTEKYFNNFYKTLQLCVPTVESLGFVAATVDFPANTLDESIVAHYASQRDFPAIAGTSKLSVHLRFGTVSVRELARKARALSDTWLNELIWRDFYMTILWHFPYVAVGAFKPDYNNLRWRNNEEEFERWCKGETGYPIVDAGMRELNTTGFMHNRVRMITASFLVKHLLIDWRWGEAYFAQKLLDFDLSANNGGWQWAASSGCDAAPYFRIFNPYEQTRRFDGQMQYIRKWVPEFEDFSYPKPIVAHTFARERVLKMYKEAL